MRAAAMTGRLLRTESFLNGWIEARNLKRAEDEQDPCQGGKCFEVGEEKELARGEGQEACRGIGGVPVGIDAMKTRIVSSFLGMH
jgi:hypothetical protein